MTAANTWTRGTLFAAAALCLNQAVNARGGQLGFVPLQWLTAALAACALGVLAPGIRLLESMGSRAVMAVLSVGLTVQVAEDFLHGRCPDCSRTAPLYTLLLGIACALLIVSFWKSRGGAYWFIAFVAVFFVWGAYHISTLPPEPLIDVLMFQTEGSRALLRGVNPYSMRFPDIYGAGSTFYGPGVSVNGWLTSGFPYPPLSLLLCLPSYLLTGDVRYSHLLAISLSGLFIGWTGSGRLSRLAAATFLLSPFSMDMVQRAWTDGFVVVLFCLLVLLVRRGVRGTAVTLGLLLAVKQYMIFVPVAAYRLLRGRITLRFVSTVLAAAALVTLPFALWDWPAFLRSVIRFHLMQPFRRDSLNYAAAVLTFGGPRSHRFAAALVHFWGPGLLGGLCFVAAIVAAGIALRKCGRGASAFAGNVAFTYIIFFALGKQAFGNYYFFVSAALCASIAAIEPGPVVEESRKL